MPIAASNESFGIQGNDRPLGGLAEGRLFASKHSRRQTFHLSRPYHLDLNYEELERSQIVIDESYCQIQSKCRSLFPSLTNGIYTMTNSQPTTLPARTSAINWYLTFSYSKWNKLSPAEQKCQRALAVYEGDVRLVHLFKFRIFYNGDIL